jgi:ABC-2 type transport system permease protein
MTLAGVLRADANLAAVNALYLGLLFLGGIAYPLEKLPAAMSGVAQLLPAAPLAELLRSALNGTSISWSALLVLAGWAIIMPIVAARTFRWEE